MSTANFHEPSLCRLSTRTPFKCKLTGEASGDILILFDLNASSSEGGEKWINIEDPGSLAFRYFSSRVSPPALPGTTNARTSTARLPLRFQLLARVRLASAQRGP